MGTVSFNSDITLNDALCVPSFNLNLMSASQVTSALNCCVILFPSFAFYMGKMIGLGKQYNGLHYMSLLQRTTACYQVSHSSTLWHMRLGHSSHSRLKLGSSLLPSNNFSCDNNCTVFPMAKHIRLPFPLSSISTHAGTT